MLLKKFGLELDEKLITINANDMVDINLMLLIII